MFESFDLGLPPQGFNAAMVSTYPPNRCGIGKFSASLVGALRTVPGMSVEVVRLIEADAPLSHQGPDVVMELDPGSPVGIRAAARRLDRYDVAVVQHEFGIYGPNDGESVVDLITATATPVVAVLHTVLPDPSPRQLAITQALGRSAAGVVALSSAARSLLVDRYGVDPDRITAIPHGSAWRPLPVSAPPRRQLLTWGLLGPGKGIERAIGALADLNLPSPSLQYRIVGQLHPSVLRRQGTSYRDDLERQVTDTGLTGRVEFDDRYQDEAGLRRAVAAADVVILPYDNREQICSGVLTEAVSAGKPVVATAFPHAVEMLGGGAGFVVDHDDPSAMTEAIRSLLTDEVVYDRAATAASMAAKELAWDSVARRYVDLFGRTAVTRRPRLAKVDRRRDRRHRVTAGQERAHRLS